jgi:heme exporter protein C
VDGALRLCLDRGGERGSSHLAAPARRPLRQGGLAPGRRLHGAGAPTGILWGKPAWGDWWVWDARLTSVLVLFFLYLGHIGLMYAFDDAARGAKAAAILALVGVINVPIIKFSVDWWNSLHQPASVIRLSGPTIHPTMLLPLLLLAVGFTFYFLTLVLVRMKSEIVAARIRAMRLAQLGA